MIESIRREIFGRAKVWEVQAYFVYSKLPEPMDRQKISGEGRRCNCAGLSKLDVLLFDDVNDAAGRQTQGRDDRQRFRLLLEHLGERPEVRLTRFRPDERKSGGVYETVSGIVKQIDSIARRIRLLDGTDIPMDDVLTLDGALFDVLD